MIKKWIHNLLKKEESNDINLDIFHGGECGFYNKKHQKQVEVVLTNPPEFGHIDSWFLLSYMQSVDKYKSEVEGMDWQRLKLVVEKLYISGKIKKIVE